MGRQYTGGHKSVKAAKSEEHGESYVKVMKTVTMTKSGWAKAKVKVSKILTEPKLIPLPFLEETPVLGMHAKKKKKDESSKDNK